MMYFELAVSTSTFGPLMNLRLGGDVHVVTVAQPSEAILVMVQQAGAVEPMAVLASTPEMR